MWHNLRCFRKKFFIIKNLLSLLYAVYCYIECQLLLNISIVSFSTFDHRNTDDHYLFNDDLYIIIRVYII